MTSAKPSGNTTNELNDVFVIGAGASVPYGFPTGAHLIQRLRKKNFVYADTETEAILVSLGFTKATLRFGSGEDALREWHGSDHGQLCAKWSRQLRGSVILTIDQFLKNLTDTNLREFGKRLMAQQILRAEKDACNNPTDPSSKKRDKTLPESHESSSSMHSIDWIQQFLTRVDLRENWRAYLEKTTFLTFNYDRVLEFFLERFLVVDKSLPREEARSFVKGMQIHHMNGFLGPLNEIPFGNLTDNSPEFDALFDPPSRHSPAIDWSDVANRMRTVWENPKDHVDASGTQTKAKAATSKAQRIFVIGTSFIPENLEAIGLTGSNRAPHGQILCTCAGLTLPQKDRAARAIGLPNNDLGKFFFDMNANDFVVDHVVL